MKTKLRRPIASLLIVFITGCAGPQKLTGNHPLSHSSHRKPVSVTGYAIPAEALPSEPRIVVDERPLELIGFEMTPEERAQFEERRAARIASASQPKQREGAGGGGGVEKGVGKIVCTIFLPACVAVAGVAGVAAIANLAAKSARASAREPSLIPEQESARLATILKVQATGASLAEQISRLPEATSVPAATEVLSPRLVVRMKAAQPDYSGTRIRVSIVAQAQAFLPTGTEWEPTEHRYEFSPVAWTANDAELVRREIDEALGALADSIWSAYSPKLEGTVKELKETVEATGPALEDLLQLVDQQQ